ncbi:MAG: hypothetical protein LBV30_10335, partial [Propionibacteriaceae bacterium]|jgi:hypothetical protein|nr:hypothetical protein [Propionibacteriaceae bacterium]
VVAVRLLGQGVARYKTTTPVTVGKFVAPTTGGVAAVTAGPVIGLVIAASTAADPWVHVLNGINLK